MRLVAARVGAYERASPRADLAAAGHSGVLSISIYGRRSETDHWEAIDVLGFSEVPGRTREGRVNNTSGGLDVQTSLIKVGGPNARRAQGRPHRRPVPSALLVATADPTPEPPNSYNNVYYSS